MKVAKWLGAAAVLMVSACASSRSVQSENYQGLGQCIEGTFRIILVPAPTGSEWIDDCYDEVDINESKESDVGIVGVKRVRTRPCPRR